jgi:antitoxin CptB
MTNRPGEGRLRWHLRRGMKELDVIVGRYYENRYPHATATERAAFARLLSEVEDPEIYSWSMGYTPPPIEYADLIAQLRRHD